MNRADIAFQSLCSVSTGTRPLTVDLKTPANCRLNLAIGCLHSAIEYQEAIIILYQNSMSGSAFSMLRVLYESVIRGFWLHRCASEAQLSTFLSKGIDVKTSELVKAVEQKTGFGNVLTQLHEMYWKPMNGFTHTGIYQVSRRFGENGFAPNYTDDDLYRLLTCTELLAHLAYGEIFWIAGRNDLRDRLSELLEETGKIKKEQISLIAS
jgi:hypothetical protein